MNSEYFLLKPVQMIIKVCWFFMDDDACDLLYSILKEVG